MKKKKAGAMELRFYEVPQNEYVLALLGDSWVREYGHDETTLHFHNLMEIGYCRSGAGELVLDERPMPYQPAMLSVIPHNYPHITISDSDEGPSFWEYIFFDPAQVVAELYPENELYQRELLEKINYKALFIHEWESRNLALIVRMIMEEMRGKRLHYVDSVKGLLFALVTEILRMNEQEDIKVEPEGNARKNAGVSQISAALEYVRVEYMHMIRVEELAKACHMSETHFRRVFEGCMNMSPVDYINLVRIQKACDLMKKTNDSMDMVAQKVGFSTTSTFNRNFKKFLNTSPYQWKINPENYEHKLLNYRISALKGW
ncbi:MAG: AraC family transcriptional regulator [Clostridiales bacterium]|nr:AraC family transcriptional regulator [Clostridiales bacterium]